MSHSQFHCISRLYLDMHGLIFETSVWLLAGSTRLLTLGKHYSFAVFEGEVQKNSKMHHQKGHERVEIENTRRLKKKAWQKRKLTCRIRSFSLSHQDSCRGMSFSLSNVHTQAQAKCNWYTFSYALMVKLSPRTSMCKTHRHARGKYVQ